MLGHMFKTHVTLSNTYLDFKKYLTQDKSLKAVPLPAPCIENTINFKDSLVRY